MRCRLIAFCIASQCCALACGQSFDSAAGARMTWGGLITYKQKIAETAAAEGILSVRWGGFAIAGLYEYYFPAIGSSAFDFYAGGGFHMGFHGRDNRFNPAEGANKTIYLNPGADLIGGVEYRFPNLPLLAGLDYKPSFHFTGERWFVGEGIGLSLRYCW